MGKEKKKKKKKNNQEFVDADWQLILSTDFRRTKSIYWGLCSSPTRAGKSLTAPLIRGGQRWDQGRPRLLASQGKHQGGDSCSEEHPEEPGSLGLRSACPRTQSPAAWTGLRWCSSGRLPGTHQSRKNLQCMTFREELGRILPQEWGKTLECSLYWPREEADRMPPVWETVFDEKLDVNIKQSEGWKPLKVLSLTEKTVGNQRKFRIKRPRPVKYRLEMDAKVWT